MAVESVLIVPMLITNEWVHQPYFALVLSLSTAALIGYGNWDLLKYLKVIAGKPDASGLIPIAIFQSAILFFAVINLYGGLFCSQMDWDSTHFALGYHVVEGTVRWFYFSAVTITTLGYGDIVPVSIASRLTVAIECLNGLIAFGVFTGAVTTYLSRE